MMFRAIVFAAVMAVAIANPAGAQVTERRWLIQSSDNKIVGLTDDYSLLEPYDPGTFFVLDSVIRMATPPGADGPIYQGGFWDGVSYAYTPPPGAVLPIDPATPAGGVQAACKAMVDVFDIALAFIHDNQLAWQQAAIRRAETGIHYQLVNAARVALNASRTHATRQKFCEESASWPAGVNGNVVDYVDAMGADSVGTPTKDWSWVLPATDVRVDVADAGQGFDGATDIEDAPGSGDLIGRGWIADIP